MNMLSKRIKAMIITASMLVGIVAAPGLTSEAATKKKYIKSVSFSISGNIEIETKMGEEDLTITASNSKYYYDYYEVENTGFRWSSDDVPEIKVYFQAEDGYQFYISNASQITVKGGTYKSAERQNSATTLVVTVTLPSLANQVYAVENPTFANNGVVSWEASEGAGSYEVRLKRGTSSVGGVQEVNGTTSIDMSQYMYKEGDYVASVRACNKLDPSVKSEWTDTSTVHVTSAMADEFKQRKEDLVSAGEWIQDSNGWWFKLPDNTYPQSAWRKIRNIWYYFDSNGYMVKGWQQIGDGWYYFDTDTGAMWYNTTTPDGGKLGIDGLYYN